MKLHIVVDHEDLAEIRKLFAIDSRIVVSTFVNQDHITDVNGHVVSSKLTSVVASWGPSVPGQLGIGDFEYPPYFERPWTDHACEQVHRFNVKGNDLLAAVKWGEYDSPIPARFWNDARTDQRPVSEYIAEGCPMDRYTFPEILLPCLRRPYPFEEVSKDKQAVWIDRVGHACTKLARKRPIVPIFDDHIPIKDDKNRTIELRELPDDELRWQHQQAKPWSTGGQGYWALMHYYARKAVEGDLTGENADAADPIRARYLPPFDPTARLVHVVEIALRELFA